MMTHTSPLDDIIGRIYEAGALPELWPDLLDGLGDHFDALGGSLIRSSDTGIHIMSSPRVREVAAEFTEQGFNDDNPRVYGLLSRGPDCGFLADSHLYSEAEMAAIPAYSQFLEPRRFAAGVGTIIQGADNDGLIVAVEAFASHEASRAACDVLNGLRPHLARAAVLSGRVQAARMATAIEACSAGSVSIALIDERGRVLGASDSMQQAFGSILLDGPARLRLADPAADLQFETALEAMAHTGLGRSIAVRNPDRAGIAVVHLVPARRDARDLFSRVAGFVVLARTGNTGLPSADLIAALFDLTPAEARVARGIAAGHSPAELAGTLGVSGHTVRSQLRSVFAKTATGRQSELAALIGGLR